MIDWFHTLGLSIQYFSRVPVPFKLKYEDDLIKRTIFFLPLIGWLIGLILYVAFQLIHPFFPIQVQSILVLSILLWITGGLHADGWMDVWDGLGSGQGKERVLEIMKDSRVGAMGVVGFFVLFAIKAVSLFTLLHSKYLIEALVLTPMIARWGVLLAIFIFPYTRESGLGMKFKHWFKIPIFILAIAWLIPIFWLSTYGLLMIAVMCFFVLISGLYFTKKLDGLTGDIYGWFIEGAEALLWLLLVIIHH